MVSQVVEQLKQRLFDESERGNRFASEDIIAWVKTARRKELRTYGERATSPAGQDGDRAGDISAEDIPPALSARIRERRAAVASGEVPAFDEEAYWQSSIDLAAALWKAVAPFIDQPHNPGSDQALPRRDVDQPRVFVTQYGSVGDIIRQHLVAPPLELEQKNLLRILAATDEQVISMSNLAQRMGLTDPTGVGAITRQLGRRINSALGIDSGQGGITGTNLLIEWKQRKVGPKREYHFKLRPGVKESLQHEGII